MDKQMLDRLREILQNIVDDAIEARVVRDRQTTCAKRKPWDDIYDERIEEIRDLVYIWKGVRQYAD